MGTKLILKTWAGLRALGPYLLIELLLPGGTLIALLLWLSQRFNRNGSPKEAASERRQEKPIGSITPAQPPAIAPIKPLGMALR